MGGYWKSFVTKLKYKSGGKEKIDYNELAKKAIIPILILFIVARFFKTNEDTTQLVVSHETLQKIAKVDLKGTGDVLITVKGVIKESDVKKEPVARSQNIRSSSAPKNIRYKATQVVVRKDYQDPNQTLPLGSNFIGKLLTTIDTRDLGKLVKILLPFGGAYQNRRVISPETTLYANFNYPGSGDKVYLDIHSGITPEGKEFEIKGHALSSNDFSSGLVGDFHGTITNRMASTLGLKFVSTFTNVMQEKESLGQSVYPTPKANFKNAALGGISDVANKEAEREFEQLEGEQPYIIIEAGSDLIVSLSKSFTKGD